MEFETCGERGAYSRFSVFGGKREKRKRLPVNTLKMRNTH